MRIVIVGAGETGVTLASRFSAMNWDVVLIDLSAEALADADEGLDVMNLVGDATHRSVLERAGTGKAHAFAAVSGSDAQNLLSAALARTLGAEAAVARVDDPGFFAADVHVESDLLGVHAVISTPRLVASKLVDRMMGVHFDLVLTFALGGIRVGVLQAARAPSTLRQSATSLKLPGGVQLMAVLRDGYVRPPAEVAAITESDRLVLAGAPDCVASAWSSLIPGVADARAVVVGGGDVGVSLIQHLEPHVGRLELVEIERACAQKLAEQFPDITVLVGDARRSSFLEDLQISSAQYVVAVTSEDETGLLIALLARRLGVAQTFSFIRQPGHAELFRAVGIEGATGLFDVVASAATNTLVGRGIVRRVPVPGTSYELVEWRIARAASDTASPSLDAVPLPARCRLIAVAHGFQAAPVAPGTRLRAGDSMVILAPRGRIHDLERSLKRFAREFGL